MKNGVIASIVLSVVLTLTLAITTIATAFSGVGVSTPDVYLAYRTEDVCTELKDYKKVNFDFDTTSASSTIVYNSETGVYTAKKATESTINASAVDKAGRTYNLHIDIYAQGNGESATSPWVIANANHVIELSSLINDDVDANNPKFVEVKADVDMASKTVDFKPIGTVSHKYSGTIEGNNKTISNLTMNVTSQNVANYTVEDASDKFLDLGLFGATSGATIKNISLANETIKVATDIAYTDYYRVVVGGLVANADNRTTIVSDKNSTISNTISVGSATNDATDNLHGVGGVVGCAVKLSSDSSDSKTEISGYTVNTRLIANQPRISSTLGTMNAGGVVGYASNTNVHDVNVTLTGNAVYNNGAYIGGVAGYLNNSSIKNSVVAGVGISGNETFKQIANTYLTEENNNNITMLGGVAAYINITSSVENVAVNNAVIDVKAKVGGISYENEGTIKDVKVNGTLIGYSVGGVANVNAGTISYSSAFSGKTVAGTMKGVYVGGVANINAGTINGKIDAERNAEVDVKINSVSGVVEGGEAELLAAVKNAYVAGLVSFNANSVSNIKVNATVSNGLNMAGLVNVMGKTSQNDTTARTATLSAISGNVNIISNNSTTISTTYSVGGAVNNVYAGSEISSVSLNVNVNKDRVGTHKYGAAFVGGLVARIYENNVSITNNAISGSIYTNYTHYTQVADEVVSEQITLGGFIGTIAGETNEDSIAQIDVNNISVYGNTISDFEIRCDALLENIPSPSGSLSFAKSRNIATFVGFIYNTDAKVSGKDWAITFDNNTMNNVHAYAKAQTFTTANSVTRYGDISYAGNTINGVSLNTIIVVNVKDQNRTNVGFEAIV